MPIIRKKLAPSEVYPDDLRYNEATDTVQSNINGVWTDNPEADPRHQTTFPPRITADTACDAAQSVVDALHGQIDEILVAIDNAATLFTIAGIILSVFTFGAYALFVSLALGIGDQMVGFGSAAISAALTEPVYHTLVCILRCQMNNQGRLTATGLALVKSDVTAQIGGIGATIINAMLSLAGEGGINNLASLGTSTGDCADCGCAPPCYENFVVSQGNFLGVFDGYARYEAALNGGSGHYVVEISTGDQNDCCLLFDWRLVSGTFFDRGRINCGTVVLQGDWNLMNCVWAMYAQTQGGPDLPFTVEILFANCP